MTLSQFLKSHTKEILDGWDTFAQTLTPAASEMSTKAIRDHAEQLLISVTGDINKKQSNQQQQEKSKGKKPEVHKSKSVARIHGTQRHYSGFTLTQVVAEFRALRANVLRLWLQEITTINDEVSYDMIRFNEAIDEIVAQSVETFSERTSRTQDTFLAILGHDLRSPLSVMATAGHYLTKIGVGSEATQQTGSRIVKNTASMTSMVNDLLEYGRVQLGGELLIKRHLINIGRICQDAIEEVKVAHPEKEFILELSGELVGSFDENRLMQVFSNLLNNAVQYGLPSKPIKVKVKGETEFITVDVCNEGPVIPSKSLEAIFNPLVQLSVSGEQKRSFSSSAGLGLFIAREMTVAHGGEISAISSKKTGTIFTVCLPLHPKK